MDLFTQAGIELDPQQTPPTPQVDPQPEPAPTFTVTGPAGWTARTVAAAAPQADPEPEPDAAAWTARTKEEKRDFAVDLKGKLEALAADIVTDPARLAEFSARWTGGLHRYTLSNTILAWCQAPEIDGTALASFNTWRKLGRTVIKGQKAVRVYAPIFRKSEKKTADGDDRADLAGFRLVPVFFLEQTQGKPVTFGCSDMIKGKEPVSIAELESIFSEYTWTRRGRGLSNGFTDGERINVADKPEHPGAMFSTGVHELAHCKLHFKKDSSQGPIDDGDVLTRDVIELEAEAVAFLVCSFFGMENEKAALYIGGWKGEAATGQLNKSGVKILKTAEHIIKRIETHRGTQADNRAPAIN